MIQKLLSGFQVTVEKPEPKQFVATNHNRSRQRDEPITIPSNYIELEAQERSRVHGAIDFDSHWLKNWRESFKSLSVAIAIT